MKYEAVIFDLDGVLVSTDHYHYQAWKAIADEENIPFDEKANNALRGVSRIESLAFILEKGSKEYSQEDREKLAEKKNDLYKESLKQLTQADLLDKVKETLVELKEKGIKIAIGSSSKNTVFILKQVGIIDLFDAISDGTQIKHSKPHPEVFMNAADELNIAYKKCLVVEDADAGCIAAKSANMDVAGISSAKDSKFSDYHLSKIDEILAIVEGK